VTNTTGCDQHLEQKQHAASSTPPRKTPSKNKHVQTLLRTRIKTSLLAARYFSLTDSLTGSLTDLLTDSLADSLTDSLTDLLTRFAHKIRSQDSLTRFAHKIRSQDSLTRFAHKIRSQIRSHIRSQNRSQNRSQDSLTGSLSFAFTDGLDHDKQPPCARQVCSLLFLKNKLSRNLIRRLFLRRACRTPFGLCPRPRSRGPGPDLGPRRRARVLAPGLLPSAQGPGCHMDQGGCSRIRMKQMTLGDKSVRQGEKLREAAEGGNSRRQPRLPNL
jgi:hypothetical protein